MFDERDMYNSVPDKTVKEMFLVKDARHTESIVKDKEGYSKAVRSFLGSFAYMISDK